MNDKHLYCESRLGIRASKDELLSTRSAMYEKAKSIGFSEKEIQEMKKVFGSDLEDGHQ